MVADPGSNVVCYLREAAARVGSRPALIVDDRSGKSRRTTFAELWDRVDRAGRGLRSRGLAPGDRVIVMVPMSIDLYVVLLAILKIGAVAVFVDPWIGMRQIAAFAAFAEPRGFVGSAKSHLLRLLDGKLRVLPLTVTTGSRVGRLPARTTLGELEAAAGDGSIHQVSAADPALITFTTGSSGTPKGANRTHGFLTAQHQALCAEFPHQDDDVEMTMFPVFALTNLASGIPSVVPTMDFRRVADVDAAGLHGQIERHGVTTCTASPPFFDRLAAHVAANRCRPDLRRVLTGGAPVSDEQLRAWQAALPQTEIVVAYGSTEAEPVAHLTASQRLAAAGRSQPGRSGYCAGRPIERIRSRLVRIHAGPIKLGQSGWPGWEVPAGEVGELIVTADHVCRDYYRNPQAVAENKIRDAEGAVWHRMGDTGYFDTEGRFWLVGRVHSTIHRNGQQVHPQLVEQAAAAGDARIRRVAAVGLPDEALGQRVVVVVESAAGESIKDEVRARLKSADQPVDEVLVTSRPLPVDPRHNAKIDYARIRDMLISGVSNN